MVQRIQTVYWLLSASLLGAVIFLPLFELPESRLFYTADCKSLAAVVIAVAALSVGNIFLFRNRPLQVKMGYLLIILHAAMLALAGAHYHLDGGQKFLPWAALPLLSLLLQILAIRSVKKDEALIKSMDRLR